MKKIIQNLLHQVISKVLILYKLSNRNNKLFNNEITYISRISK